MSYEPDAHKVQMKILRYLLMNPSATFSQLRKDANMQSDHITFHIKKLEKEGFLVKKEKFYTLSQNGKVYANRMDTDENVIERQPKLSVVLIIENNRGEFLTQERLKHPYYGYWGHPTGKIRWGETVEQAASRELMEETGLSADFRCLGIYHKIDINKSDGELLEDKYFCLMYGTQPKGDLIIEDEGHHNEWMSLEAFKKLDKKFGSVEEIRSFTKQNGFIFKERKFYYKPEDF